MAEKEPFKVAVPAPVSYRPARPAEEDPLGGRFRQRTMGVRDQSRGAQGTGRLLAKGFQLAPPGAGDQPLFPLQDDYRRHPDPFHPRARQGTAADPIDPEPRLAVDILGPAQGHPPSGGPGRLRRVARRRLRRGGAVASRLRFLHPADHHRHQLLAHRRPVGPTDAGSARL